MKNFLYISIASAVVVGGAAFFLLFNTKTDDAKTPTGNEVVVVVEDGEDIVVDPINGVGSMRSILSMGANLECTVSYQPEEYMAAQSEGTVFVSNNRMRGDSVVTIDGKEIVSSVIIRDDEMYSWSLIDGEKYGMKISLTELMNAQESDTAPDFREPVPIDSDVDYSCKQWKNIDNSIFEVPTDTIFKDYTDLVNTGMEYGNSYSEEGGEANKCAVCEYLTGSDKSQCMTAFSCQ